MHELLTIREPRYPNIVTSQGLDATKLATVISPATTIVDSTGRVTKTSILAEIDALHAPVLHLLETCYDMIQRERAADLGTQGAETAASSGRYKIGPDGNNDR